MNMTSDSAHKSLDESLRMEVMLRENPGKIASELEDSATTITSPDLYQSTGSLDTPCHQLAAAPPPALSPTSVIVRKSLGCIDGTSHAMHKSGRSWSLPLDENDIDESDDDDDSCCSFGGDDDGVDLRGKVSWKGLDTTIEIERLEDSGVFLGDLFYTTDEIEVARKEAYLESCEFDDVEEQ